MRIIGGKYAKRIIHPPRNLPVRPTTDLAKESLFNILKNKINLEEKTVLDLFAGTGALSYEFASRGCKSVIAVDINYQSLKFIKQTATSFGMNQIKPVRSDVFRFINSCRTKFDLIFADPPYDMENIPHISQTVFENELLNSNGWLIVEHPKTVDFSGEKFFVKHRRYGHVNFSFFQYLPNGENS